MPGTDLVPRALYELSIEEPTKFRRIFELTYDELERRLLESPKEFNESQLVRLFDGMNKAVMALRKTERPDSAQRTINVMQIIPGLPVDRQVELLVAEIHRMEEEDLEASAERAYLAQLVGKDKVENVLAIEVEASE